MTKKKETNPVLDGMAWIMKNQRFLTDGDVHGAVEASLQKGGGIRKAFTKLNRAMEADYEEETGKKIDVPLAATFTAFMVSMLGVFKGAAEDADDLEDFSEALMLVIMAAARFDLDVIAQMLAGNHDKVKVLEFDSLDEFKEMLAGLFETMIKQTPTPDRDAMH